MKDDYRNIFHNLRAYRRDPTGSWNEIQEPDSIDPWWVHVLGGSAAACLIAIGFAYAMGWNW